MNTTLARLFMFFAHLGGFGLLALGVLDSSFLFVPLANDLLVVDLSARHHAGMPYYAMMATTGSVLGSAITDWFGRKEGEKGLERALSPKRVDYVEKRIKKSAALALAFASLMPPPFPFTIFVGAAAAGQYPRKKLLAVIAASRFVRFSIEGLLAVLFGRRILKWFGSPAVHDLIFGLAMISVIGSAYSIYHWVRRSKKAASKAA